MNRHWLIDEMIDLTSICETEAWHLASVVYELIEMGLERKDAEAFADMAFRCHADIHDGGEIELTPEQVKRLSVVKG